MTSPDSSTLYLRLPAFIDYPVVVVQAHVKQGDIVQKSDPLYTMRDAKGGTGIMHSPFAARIDGPTVPPGTSFPEPVPVIAFVKLEAPAEQAKPVQTPPPEAQPVGRDEPSSPPKPADKAPKEPGFLRRNAGRLAFLATFSLGLLGVFFWALGPPGGSAFISAGNESDAESAFGDSYLSSQVPFLSAQVRRYEVNRPEILKERQRRYDALVEKLSKRGDMPPVSEPSTLEQKAFELWLY